MPVLDVVAIREILPHRYPFLLIDRAIDYVPNKSIRGIKNSQLSPCHSLNCPESPDGKIVEQVLGVAAVKAFDHALAIIHTAHSILKISIHHFRMHVKSQDRFSMVVTR